MTSNVYISDNVKVAVITSNQLEDDDLPPRGKIMYLILHTESSMKMLAPRISDRTEEQCDHVLETIKSAVELSEIEVIVSIYIYLLLYNILLIYFI